MHVIHRCQKGFTTVTLMGVLLIGGLFVAASFAAVDPDISFSRQDQDQKQAYGAAEAGLQWYLSRLGQDNNYYVNCTQVPAPSPTEPAPVNLAWNGLNADPRVWRSLPGEAAQYTVELMPATGFSSCLKGNQYSMIDSNGNMRLRVSGRSRDEVRTLLATLRRQNLIDFIWFTDFETLDPAAYSSSSDVTWATQNCATYRNLRHDDCEEIAFITNDYLQGPVHTNDSVRVCGNPTFGRDTRDAIEIVGQPPYTSKGCTDSKTVKGTGLKNAQPLAMPSSNAELANIATPNYRFTGKTEIELNGTTMSVKNTARTGGSWVTMNMPANGVIYVANTACSVGYVRSQTYAKQPTGCGDVWISGSYSRDLTIGADNDVVIDDNLVRAKGADGSLLGLIANNFVRIYHPVDSKASPCANATGSVKDLTVEAAILALQHSFIADNWFCGRLGTLKVYGAIAQKYRGTVGTTNTATGQVSTGYLKNYEYNNRLRYREPPYFLDPVQASWRIARETEQARAVKQR